MNDTAQLDIFTPRRHQCGRIPPPPRPRDERTIAERFEEFHRNNPQVFDLFRRFAEQALLAGQRVGAKAIFERMRWETAIVTRGDTYSLNNSYTALYARLLEETDPRFVGFFEQRKRRSE